MPREFEGRIFFDQLMQPKTDFFDVDTGLRLDCKGQYRARKRRFLITDGCLFVAERVAGLRIFEFPDCHDVPCAGSRQGCMFLSQHSVQMPAFFFAVPRTVKDCGVCVKNPR